MTEKTFDIGVIGGGPAGLSAAIWSARYLHSVCVIDSGDPRNWETLGVNGYLGLDEIRPAELRGRGRETARSLGVDLIDGVVLRVDQTEDEHSLIQLEGGAKIVSKRLLLAIGIRDVWPDLPGIERAYGSNAHVCPDCDGFDARDKKVVVIGNGRRAVGMALNLTTWTRDIIICTNGRPPELELKEYCEKLDALNIPVLAEPIKRVTVDTSGIHCLTFDNGMPLDANKIFFAIAQYPADDLGVQLGCERDEEGRIVVDGHGHTSVENVFAAGDITPGPQLAIAAAAEGAVAAIAMHKSLIPMERRLTPLVAATS